MIVPIEPIQQALKVIEDFNALDLNQVTLTEKGRPISFALEGWKFLGLTNKNLVEMRFWELEWEDTMAGEN